MKRKTEEAVRKQCKISNKEKRDNIMWKILHSDGSHIYLIASDYIPNTACPGSAT